MLIIYSALVIGGIETFFLRMVKIRHQKGLKTKVLLLYPESKSNKEILSQVKLYCDVYFYDEIFFGPKVFSRTFPLIAPVRREKLNELMSEVEQIHAFIGKHVLLGYRLSCNIERSIPITIGFYHYLRYAWPANKIAYHEKINRKFAFDYLPSKSLMFFSDDCKEFNESHCGKKLPNSNTFRLGVVDEDIPLIKRDKENTCLKIVSVGRLVDFKTYNSFMLDVIKDCISLGIDVEFDIFGYGPLEKDIKDKIIRLELENYVSLKGVLNYSDFDNTLAKYDIFIGSGTAIIQASASGIPSIVGIENSREPVSYGFFSDVYRREYNLKGLDLKLVPIVDILKEYTALTHLERKELRSKHRETRYSFLNQDCEKKFDDLKIIEMPFNKFKFSLLFYEISWVFDMTNAYLNKNHPFTKRHRVF